jgi:hypothetical protein
MPKISNVLSYEAIAAEVRANYDLIPGSRTEAARNSGYTPAAISHILVGRRRSWPGIKFLTHWYRKQYPGVGQWRKVGEILVSEFPNEPEWLEVAES